MIADRTFIQFGIIRVERDKIQYGAVFRLSFFGEANHE